MDQIPLLRTHVTASGIRLELGQWSYGNGRTLQEAADDLIARLADMARAIRAGRIRFVSELGVPDPAYVRFLWQLGELVDRPDRIREEIFGSRPTSGG
jgi:hypothetical protein